MQIIPNFKYLYFMVIDGFVFKKNKLNFMCQCCKNCCCNCHDEYDEDDDPIMQEQMDDLLEDIRTETLIR